MEFERVISILDRDAGTHFDTDCVNGFKKIKLDVLIKMLEYDSHQLLDPKDLNAVAGYNIKQLLSLRAAEENNGDDQRIADIFEKYYNKKYPH